MKKCGVLFLSLVLACVCFSNISVTSAFAATGQVKSTDTQTKVTTSTTSDSGSVCVDSGGSGDGKSSGVVGIGCSGGGGNPPTPAPTPTPSQVPPPEDNSGSLISAVNSALAEVISSGSGTNSLIADLQEPNQPIQQGSLLGERPMFASIGEFGLSTPQFSAANLSQSLDLLNPIAGVLSFRSPRSHLLTDLETPQSIVCGVPQQLVWISAPGQEYLEADDVGNCAQLSGCRNAEPAGGGSSAETYFANYNYGFGNALAVLACNDVVVAGGGYKTYSGYFSKNAFAWRSSRPEGDRMRYLNRDVGCQTGGDLWNFGSKQCGTSATCGPGTCGNHRARFAEATAISVDPLNAALNIVGEMSWQGTGLTADLNRDGYTRASRAGFLWRGVYVYPSNTGPVNQLSSNEVPKNRLSDSLHLLSAYGSGTDHYAIGNQVLRTSMSGSVALEIPGVNREYTYIAPPDPLPTHIYGANWQLSSFTRGQARHLSPVVSLKDDLDVEFSTTLAAAVDQGTGAISARGISGYMGTEGQCQTSGCEHAASRFALDSGQHVSISLLEGDIDWGTIPPGTWQDYLWTRATAMSKDTTFTVGQAYDATTSEVGFTNGSTGDSIKYGFHQGVPVIWSDSRRPRAIALPDGYAGGIALGVTSYGARQAIVVGTMVKSGIEQLPEGFVSVCTRGSETSICCTNAIPTKDYLASRGFTLGENVKMFNTTAAETVGNRVYFTGTGREVSSTAKPYVAKIEFSPMCEVNTCQ